MLLCWFNEEHKRTLLTRLALKPSRIFDAVTNLIVFSVTSDLNECALNTTVCQPGVCMNTNGAFKCDCPKGYKPTKDAKACTG